MGEKTLAGKLIQYIPENIRRRLVAVLNRIHLLNLALLYTKSILTEYGWFKSRAREEPVSPDGENIPWMTYCSIHFLDGRLENTRIFEYGCGNSTVWYAERASEVISAEHDEKWFQKVRSEMPANASLRHTPKSSYPETIVSEGPFDVIVVDGVKRNQCIEATISELSDTGVIILDDAQRDTYASGKQMLHDRGFKSLNLTGLKPINRLPATTAIYYKDNNCLGL